MCGYVLMLIMIQREVMRIVVSLLDGNMRKGTVEEDTLIRDLAARLKLDPDCCLTLAGVLTCSARSMY